MENVKNTWFDVQYSNNQLKNPNEKLELVLRIYR